jgi:hypothetical protein
MLIIGCDFHPSGQQVFGMDNETGEVFAEQWLDHSGKAVAEFYSSLPAGAEVGVESTGNLLCSIRRLFVCRAARVIPWGKPRARE